ncbi:MAG: hypothetical protein NZ571_10470 [Anaerolineae bacterium]|nr:hypothetical protein [Anaerolineae bacterium]
MLNLPLAHGALGWWDEIFVALAIGIFLVMFFAPMLNTTLRRARSQSSEMNDSASQDTPSSENTPDTFRLE